MAGGGGGGGAQSRELDHTPTWAVSLVCGIIIIISILMEKTLHKVGEVFSDQSSHFFSSFLVFCFS